MGMEEIHSTIRRIIADNFGDAYIVVHDNAPAPPLRPGNEPQPWIRAAVRTSGTRQTGIGGTGRDANRYRTFGTVLLSLFDASERGDGTLLRLADRIVKTFRSVTVRGVVFRTPSVTTVGRLGGSWQVNVSCPFYADEVGA